jgi:polar amino acid transport system substrate-binding protein
VHTGPLRSRGIAVGISVLAGTLALSACNAKTTTPGKKSALETIKKNGKIVIATDASYAPNEFKQNGQIVGFDVDLGSAIAKKLGVTPSFQDVKFDNILPALQSKKYDISLSSFTDNKQREASFDFVTYFSAGTGLMVKAGNPEKLTPEDLSLCGKKVAVEKGTTQEDELTPKSSAKPDAGSRVDTCKQGRRVRRQAVGWQVHHLRERLRHRAVRHRDPEERERPAGRDPEGRQGSDLGRHLQATHRQVGHLRGRHHRSEGQRREWLRTT